MATKPVDMSIPPEIAKAFEVKELPAVAAAPAATGPSAKAEAPASKRKKKTRKRHAKDDKKAEAEGVAGIAGPGNMDFVIPNRRPQNDPICVGEKLWMDVTWLNTKAGEFELEVLPHKVMNGRKVYDLKGTARTSELFSLVYKAEDFVESFVDFEGWFPYKFLLHGDETKHIRNNLELFDHGARKQYIATYDNRVQKGEIVEDKGFKDLTPLSQDSLSAIYYVRTLPFEIGKVLRFPMTTNGNQWETEVSVLGREEVSTKMGYMKAFKTKIETRFKGVLQQQGDAFMWFSDDERKYLLRFEAKVRIGSVVGVTRKIETGVSPDGSTPPLPQGPSGKATEAKDDATKTSGVNPGDRGDPNQRGRHRKWFHELLESVSSAVKKK
ncbi:MAG: DUF3108 domain-containing protein [Deltaproteobacteria bacterium]|nr:DUF3108 domain-containing protein [Deltaproteobacteria bacterium]